MEENKATAIYIRVSTEEQAKDGFSINAQKEKLTKYAYANDWTIIDYYIDNGISGKNIIERTEINRMLNDVKVGRINNILIYKLDRLTRSVKDLIYLIELFEKYNCSFNSQTERIDTSNAVGRMFIKIMGIFAEFERENLAERVSFGYEQKTREGNYTNTNGVYGYDYIVGKQRLVVNEEEKILVNKIYDLYIEGKSYYKISRLLNSKNVKTKRGGNWSASTIKSIITNPLYIGIVRYGVNKKDKRFSVDGKDIPLIINKEKWELANKIIIKRSNNKTRRYSNNNNYYNHFLKCAICGGVFNSRQQYQSNKLYITYRCSNSILGLCNCETINQTVLEKNYLEYINNFDIEDKYNLKVNWLHLTNDEKKQFLERFINYIEIEKINKNIKIKTITFK